MDQNYIHTKNLVIKAERRVLKELGFCVHIKHPHKIIVLYLQVLGYENNQKLMQYSWNYMNDALRTDVFVRYQPETVACACIYLTARKLKLPLPKSPHWYIIFGATEKEIRDICVKILKLYNRSKPNIDDLERQVEELCEKYKSERIKVKGISGENSPTNESQNVQKTSAHNAWGGFISRSGSHMPPPMSEKRSRSRSETRSPDRKHKKNKKHNRSRSRSQSRTHKKSHKRKSYSRSRSNSPHKSRKARDRKKSRSVSNDRETKNDRYIDRYDKYDKDAKYKDHDRDSKYKEDRDRDRYDKYEDKKDSKKYDRDEKHRDRDDKYRDREEKYSSRDEKYKKSKYRDEERSKDRRRRS